MDALELKVPPPVVALVAALGMWALSRLTFAFEVNVALRTAVAVVIALIGGAFDVAGIAAFRRARTTLNPMRPPSEMLSFDSLQSPLLAAAPNALPMSEPHTAPEATSMLVCGLGRRR